MDVQLLKRPEYADWDRFTATSPQGSVFSRSWYLDACKASYEILACKRSEEIVGGIVLTRSKWGRHTNPLLCKYLGILVGPSEGSRYTQNTNSRKIQAELIGALGKRRGFRYMFHPGYTDWLPFYWAGYRQTTRYTYRTALDGGAGVEADFISRLRGKINKAEKDGGLQLITDIPDRIVYDLMARTFEHSSSRIPFSEKWFLHYMTGVREHNALSLTGIEGKDGINCVLGIVRDEKAHYLLLNGVDHNAVQAGENEWLIWKAMAGAAESGAAVFDFEGSMMRNVESFYRQFGGDLTPYFEIRR